MKKLFVALLLLLACSSAFGSSNSNPGLYYGQVPTAGQWNSYFSAKLDYNPGAANTIPYWDGSGNLLNAAVSGDCISAANVFVCSATSAINLVGGNSTTLLGSIPYQSNVNTTTLLPPNTTAAKLFLSQTGTGSNGAVPAWGLLVSADIPNNVANTSGNAKTATTLQWIAGGLTASTTINDTVSYTTGGITLASQTATAGQVWRIRASGTFVAVSSATARNVQVAPFWGAQQLTATTDIVLVSVAQTTNWECEFILTGVDTTHIWTTGYLLNKVDTPAIVAGVTEYRDSAHPTPASVSVTSGAQTIDLRFSMSSAVATDQWVIEQVTIERIK